MSFHKFNFGDHHVPLYYLKKIHFKIKKSNAVISLLNYILNGKKFIVEVSKIRGILIFNNASTQFLDVVCIYVYSLLQIERSHSYISANCARLNVTFRIFLIHGPGFSYFSKPVQELRCEGCTNKGVVSS